jgi:hypothetical protein
MFTLVITNEQEEWVVWVTLLSSLILGAFAGYATSRWGHIGVFIVGGWMGGVLGSLFYSMIMIRFMEHNDIIAWFMVALFALILSWLS